MRRAQSSRQHLRLTSPVSCGDIRGTAFGALVTCARLVTSLCTFLLPLGVGTGSAASAATVSLAASTSRIQRA